MVQRYTPRRSKLIDTAFNAKAVANGTTLVGTVHAIKNNESDGGYAGQTEPLYDVLIHDRRNETYGDRSGYLVNDCASAVPVQVGHRVFVVVVNGDLHQGAYILQQTVEPVQWVADSGVINDYAKVWQGDGTSGLAVGTVGSRDLSEREQLLITEGSIPNPTFLTSQPVYRDFLVSDPASTHEQTSFAYIVARKTTIFQLTLSHTLHEILGFGSLLMNFISGTTGQNLESESAFTWKVGLSYNLPGEDPVFLPTRVGRKIAIESLPFEGSSRISAGVVVQKVDVVENHPLTGVEKTAVVEDVLAVTQTFVKHYRSRGYEFQTDFVLDGTGIVGKAVELKVYVELFIHDDLTPSVLITSEHHVDNLKLVLSETGIGSVN